MIFEVEKKQCNKCVTEGVDITNTLFHYLLFTATIAVRFACLELSVICHGYALHVWVESLVWNLALHFMVTPYSGR